MRLPVFVQVVAAVVALLVGCSDGGGATPAPMPDASAVDAAGQDAAPVGDAALLDAAPTEDAGPPPDGTIAGSIGGASVHLRSVRATFTLGRLLVRFYDQPITCGAATRNLEPPNTRWALAYVDAPQGSSTIAPGTYPIHADAPAVHVELVEQSATCAVDILASADGSTGTSGSVTIAEVSAARVRGSFTATVNGGTLSGTFDTPMCDAADVDAGGLSCP